VGTSEDAEKLAKPLNIPKLLKAASKQGRVIQDLAKQVQQLKDAAQKQDRGEDEGYENEGMEDEEDQEEEKSESSSKVIPKRKRRREIAEANEWVEQYKGVKASAKTSKAEESESSDKEGFFDSDLEEEEEEELEDGEISEEMSVLSDPPLPLDDQAKAAIAVSAKEKKKARKAEARMRRQMEQMQAVASANVIAVAPSLKTPRLRLPITGEKVQTLGIDVEKAMNISPQMNVLACLDPSAVFVIGARAQELYGESNPKYKKRDWLDPGRFRGVPLTSNRVKRFLQILQDMYPVRLADSGSSDSVIYELENMKVRSDMILKSDDFENKGVQLYAVEVNKTLKRYSTTIKMWEASPIKYASQIREAQKAMYRCIEKDDRHTIEVPYLFSRMKSGVSPPSNVTEWAVCLLNTVTNIMERKVESSQYSKKDKKDKNGG
jgi:hypothetical protein